MKASKLPRRTPQAFCVLALAVAVVLVPIGGGAVGAAGPTLRESQEFIRRMFAGELAGTSALFSHTRYVVAFERCAVNVTKRTSTGIMSTRTTVIRYELKLKHVTSVDWSVTGGMTSGNTLAIRLKTRKGAVKESGGSVTKPFMKSSVEGKKWRKETALLQLAFGFNDAALRYGYRLVEAFRNVVSRCGGRGLPPKAKKPKGGK